MAYGTVILAGGVMGEKEVALHRTCPRQQAA